MANHELPELLTQLEQAASTNMRKVEKTDDVDADFINPLFRQLLINDKFAFEKMKAMMAMNFVNNLLKTTDKNLLNAINELFDRIVQNSNLINQKSPSNHSHSNYLEKGNGITSASQIYNKTQVDAMIRQLQQNGITSQQIEQMITASILLTKLKSVDGSNSGLDADLLDGFHASDFLRANGKAHDSYKLEGKPSSYYATSARVEQLFQSAVDGKQAHINRINALLGYNSGLTTNHSWNDIVWHWEHNVMPKFTELKVGHSLVYFNTPGENTTTRDTGLKKILYVNVIPLQRYNYYINSTGGDHQISSLQPFNPQGTVFNNVVSSNYTVTSADGRNVTVTRTNSSYYQNGISIPLLFVGIRP